ncbi:TM0106 family RecB-like putative nuclease [Myxosarcina sp. GI1]|uniref:TM0106 family RecB-like putative nuclease n=1 Tax=Myxosarcina sp. GI1 TaxID=1541065 RepID=UPI000560EC54|nr:TM0106 family RecB-like putative nuclease [Myxosarcina sp. GI1]
MLLTDYLLLNYKRCSRRTFLDIYGDFAVRDPEKEFLLKLKRENQAHIRQILAARSQTYRQPEVSRHNWQLNFQQTVALMAQGADCIYGGMLALNWLEWQDITIRTNREARFTIDWESIFGSLTFLAAPSLLLKQPGYSKFGDWQYIPVNIKLGRRPKPEYKLIAAFNGQILAAIQEAIPTESRLILRQGDEYNVSLEFWQPKMQMTVADCLQVLAEKAKPEVFISRQKCNLCHWYSYCYATAQAQQHLSLVPGITPKRYQDLKEFGVNNLESLATVSQHQLQEIVGSDIADRLRQQVRAIIEGQAIVKSSYNRHQLLLPTAEIELYFDIEAEPERQIDYLLGVLIVDRDRNQQQFHAFLAETTQDEGKIWQQFWDFVSLYPDAPIFHYSEYEVDTVKRLARLYGTPKTESKALLSRFVDLHQQIMNSVVFPVESYSLKSLANWIGFDWRDTEASGDISVCWYDSWLATGDRAWLELILRYNEDDCLATYRLKDWVVNFLALQTKIY